MHQQKNQRFMENGNDAQPKYLPPRPIRSRFMLLLLLILLILGALYFLCGVYMTSPLGGVHSWVAMTAKTFSPCFDEPVNLNRWIKPPPSLIHGMSDEELLWRASFAPRIKEYPFQRTPKIALMFLAKGHLPLFPLWEKFLSGHEGLYNVYIHSLPSYEPKYPSSSPFYQRQIPSKVSEWGRMSMCEAERRLLANALLDISNERFVLLSESCIPLYNFSTVYNYLTRSRYSFMQVFDDLGPYGRGRYNPNMRPKVDIMDWRKGSQWFEVNRQLAVTIVQDSKYHPLFEQFCKPACYVDEHYFQTMLSIEVPHLLANRSLTFVDWSRGGPHPATFGVVDIKDAFLRKILENKTCNYNDETTSVCFLFGRKFSPSTLQPLLQLAPTHLGFG